MISTNMGQPRVWFDQLFWLSIQVAEYRGGVGTMQLPDLWAVAIQGGSPKSQGFVLVTAGKL